MSELHRVAVLRQAERANNQLAKLSMLPSPKTYTDAILTAENMRESAEPNDANDFEQDRQELSSSDDDSEEAMDISTPLTNHSMTSTSNHIDVNMKKRVMSLCEWHFGRGKELGSRERAEALIRAVKAMFAGVSRSVNACKGIPERMHAFMKMIEETEHEMMRSTHLYCLQLEAIKLLESISDLWDPAASYKRAQSLLDAAFGQTSGLDDEVDRANEIFSCARFRTEMDALEQAVEGSDPYDDLFEDFETKFLRQLAGLWRVAKDKTYGTPILRYSLDHVHAITEHLGRLYHMSPYAAASCTRKEHIWVVIKLSAKLEDIEDEEQTFLPYDLGFTFAEGVTAGFWKSVVCHPWLVPSTDAGY